MKKFLLITIIFFFNNPINAQPLGWTEQVVNPAPPRLNCVSVNIGGTEGWIGGDSGTILYTSNMGVNWQYCNNPTTGNNSINVIASMPGGFIFAFITDKALCSSTYSNTTYIYRTTNKGNNWTNVYQRENSRIRSIFMTDTLNGYAIGDPIDGWWTILKTTNGGITFDSLWHVLPQNGSEVSNYNTMFKSTVPPLIMFGTNNGRIYRSSNNGLNWTSISVPFQNIYALQLGKYTNSNQANQFGYAMGTGSVFTTDFGQSWTPISLPGNGDIPSLYTEGFYGNSGFACYAKGSQIYSTTNITQPFTLEYTSPNGGNYTQISLSLFMFENGVRAGWGVKDNGTISRYYVFIAGVKKINSSIPLNFSLSQNFPNPFNPVTKIRFCLPLPSKGGAQDVQLIIYDILGREVASLVNEQLKPGTYEVEWDGSNSPSGVYFYKLITADFIETRKMVLIK